MAARRNYKEADETYRAAAELDPNFPWSYRLRAWSYEARGTYDLAIADLNKTTQVTGSEDVSSGELAYALGRSGHREDAQRILDRMQIRARSHFVSSFDLARAYEGLGRRDEAMEALMRACDEHSPFVAFLKSEPVFEPLRADPRFEDVLRRIHLD